jgi:PGF-pre-PGF domain-containing protein
VSLTEVDARDNENGLNVIASGTGTVTNFSTDTVGFESATDAAVFEADGGTIEDLSFTSTGFNESGETGLTLLADDGTVRNVSLDTVDARNNTLGLNASALGSGTISGLSTDTVGFGESEKAGSDAAVLNAEGSTATIEDVVFELIGLNQTAGTGLRISATGGEVRNVSLDTADVRNNTNGLEVVATGSGLVSGFSTDTVGFESVEDAGVFRATNAVIEDLDFDTTGFNKSGETGLTLLADDGTVRNVSMDTVIASDNTVGVNATAAGTGLIRNLSADTVLVSDNVDGARIAADDDALVEDVRIRQSGLNGSTNGIVFGGDGGAYSSVRVVESLIRDNAGTGVLVTENANATGLRVKRSLIGDNGAGVENRNDTTILDARNNWWGNSSGPSSPGATTVRDPVNDKGAIGEGDSVSTGVRFDPAIGGKNRNEEDDQIVDPITFVAGTNGVPANFSVEFAGITIEGPVSDFVGVNVWERAALPFRADEDDAANRVRNAQVFIRSEEEGDVSINRDFLKVYQKGERLNITFRQATGANTTRFANKEVQFHVFRANDSESLSGAFSQSINETTGDVSLGSDDVEIVELRDLGRLDGSGEISLEFTPDEAGEYLFALTTVESGDGFELDDTGTGRLSANVLNDSTVFAGFETIGVQNNNSTVTPEQDRVVAGEELTFNARSNLTTAEVDHAVLLYDKAAFENKLVFVNDTSVDVSGDNVVFNLTGTADGSPFLISVNATQDCDPNNSTVPGSIDDAEENPCVNDITTSESVEDVASNATILLSGNRTENISVTVPRDVAFTDGTKTFQWVHTAAASGDASQLSTDVGTVTVIEPPEIEVNRTDIAYGNVSVGASRTVGVNVTNLGTADLNLTSLEVVGPNASQFAIDTGASTLGAGESTTIRVTFTPNATGLQSAELRIESNDEDEPILAIPLSGTGRIAPVVDVDPANLTFGQVTVGSTETASVTVSNVGTAPLSVDNLILAGSDPGQFAIDSSSVPTTLAPGENTTIEMAFEPTSGGAKTARLDIETNDTDAPTTPVSLSGSGVVEEEPTEVVIVESSSTRVRVRIRNLRAGQSVNVPTTGLGDADVRFDGVNIRLSNTISTSGSVEIDFEQTFEAPTGTPALTGAGDIARYLEVTPSGIDDDDIDNVRFRFRVSDARLGDRDPENVVLYRFSDGGWSPLETTFVGKTGGDFNRFVATSPGFSTFAIAIQEAEFEITDTTLDPESVFVGENATATATVENTGTAGGNYTAQLTANGNPIETQTVFVPAGESRTVEFTVAFDTAETFDLAINGTGVGTLTVSEPPEIAVDPASVDFGDVAVGGSATEAVTVTNDGSTALELTSIGITGADADAFAIASNGSSTVAPGESTTVEIEFAPESTGETSAGLEIGSNDPDAPSTTVPLSGTGDPAPDIANTPKALLFGTVTTADSETTRLLVTNFGDMPLEINSVNITGLDAGAFSIVDGGSSTVAPGERTEIRVGFAPDSVGPKTAQLEIDSNDPNESTATVDLLGTGAGVPEIAVDPATVEFGTVTIGDSASEDVTVTNTGNANLTITAVSLGGPDAGAFDAPSLDEPITLAPGESVTEAVTFGPTSAGEKTATLSIESDDPAQQTTEIALSGTAEEAVSDIAVDPAAVEFGEVTVGGAATDSVAVSNEGDAPLDLTAVSVTGSDAGAFAVTDSGDGTVAPGETTTVEIEFAPESAGAKSAGLEIESNDPDAPSTTVPLSGTGDPVPDIANTPKALLFGTVTTADSETTRLLVTNFGDMPLEINSVNITGLDAGAFSIVDGGSSTVAPGERTEIRVGFAPDSVGPKTAQLEIDSNDPNESTATVDLLGTGAGVPEIAVDPATVEFGTVTIGDSASEDVTVTNTGNANLTITAVSLGGPDAGAFDAPSLDEPITLAPGESVTEAVTFGPTSAGEKTATLSIESDDPAQQTTEIALSGTAEEAVSDIAVDPAAVEFGEVTVGGAATDSVAVSNEGDAPLDLTAVSVTGSDAGAFAVTDSGDGTVAPGETTTIQLEFAPGSAGETSAVLEIESNDPDEGTVSVDLSGTGGATPTVTPPTPTPTEPPATTTPPPGEEDPPVALIVIVVILLIVGILAALYFRGDPGLGDTGGG